MTPHANSTPVDARPWQDSDVQWFGSSQRIVAGRPDTRYGWLETDSGPCIVKALDLELATYSSTLLAHERAVLRRLRERGAPVPELMASPDGQDRPDWLVTRFAGLSAEMLDGAQLATDEGLAAWAALLESAVAFDRAGALPVDLWAANLVLPLTHVVSGQLVLSRVVLIDHAHTAVAGINLRRPLLMARMARVAPELREALRLDQEAMARTFREAGVPSPTMAATGVEARAASQRLWAEYDEPQELQRLLDSGRLRIDAAIQFAVGHALTGLAAALPAPSATALLAVVKRLTAAEPQARFADLPSAARAVRSVITDVPRVGHVVFPRVTPSFMAAAVSGAKPAKQRDTAFAGHTAIVGADDRMAAQRQPAETALEPALPQFVGRSAPVVSNAPWTEIAGQDAVPPAAATPAAAHGAEWRAAPSQPTSSAPRSAEVVAVDAPSQPISGSRTPQPRRSRRWAVAAVALLAIGSASAWRALQPGRIPTAGRRSA